MKKKLVYVESSVISYLTSRPSRDIVRLGKQRLTAEWWERREEWELCISPTVLEEVSAGDSLAAEKRVAIAKTMIELPMSQEAGQLAALLVAQGAVPSIAITDAVHLSMAALHGVPYLLTWNQRHLDNVDLRQKIETVIKGQGLAPALVLTPERILEKRP